MSPKDEIRILVADDDVTLLELMTHRFNKMGELVDTAEDGRIAMRLIERKTYDLIVADIYMPGATGLALLREAKKRDPQVQVIIITAGATLDNAVESLNNGAFAYLTKPFDHISVFDNVVSRALEYRRLLLDNQRMAEIQRRRGDMLEDEVTQRVQQLKQRQRDLLDLLGSLPDGVIVVEEGGRVRLSSPVAEKWMARELRSGGQPIQRFLETVHDEWAKDRVEVEVGSHVLFLMAVDLPPGNGKKSKVVVIREIEGGAADSIHQMSDPLDRLKQGLAWLYKRQMGIEVSEVVKHLASQVSELERLSGVSKGSNGRAQHPLSAVQQSKPSVEERSSNGQHQEPPPGEQVNKRPAIKALALPMPERRMFSKYRSIMAAREKPVEEAQNIEKREKSNNKTVDVDSTKALEALQEMLDRATADDGALREGIEADEDVIERPIGDGLLKTEGHVQADIGLRGSGFGQDTPSSIVPSMKQTNWPPQRISAS